jgi:hypothetical protein
MIKFTRVTGDVVVDDRRGRQTLAASTGMEMPSHGANCIIATVDGGHATLFLEGKRVDLGPSSFIRIQPDGRSFLQKHRERVAKGSKLALGRLWAMAMEEFGTEREEVTSNAVVGVRG